MLSALFNMEYSFLVVAVFVAVFVAKFCSTLVVPTVTIYINIFVVINSLLAIAATRCRQLPILTPHPKENVGMGYD